MGVKNEKLQYKLTKFLVPQQKIVASWWQKIWSTFDITTGNATPYLYIINYIPTAKLKLSVHISQDYGEFKCF